VFYSMLVERGLLDFYIAHYAEVFEPMLDMMFTGIMVDNKKRIHRLTQYQAEVIELQDKISEVVGQKCWAKKSLRNEVLMDYVYGTLKIPKMLKTRKRKGGEKVRTPGLDEVIIKRLMIRFPEKMTELGNLVLEHRRKYALMGMYSENLVDDAGRFLSSYAPYADTGRFRSSASPLGPGANGQNRDRETRDIYVPDNF
jgi:hypothetical protein